VTGGSATGKIATINVTFKATSHQAQSCVTGSETIYTGTMSGEAELVTGLSGGGTVGGKSVTFDASGTKPEVTVNSDCVQNTDECTASTLWGSGSSAGQIEAVGLSETASGKSIGVVGVVREVKLSAPKGATRTDLADAATAAPSYNSGTKVLSVTTTSSGLITGSATLSGGKVATVSEPCTYKGKRDEVKTTENETANYASPAGKAITAHTALTGNLAVPASIKNALFFISTVTSG
jgi:hypothetical protein